jgi:hypothetical protein
MLMAAFLVAVFRLEFLQINIPMTSIDIADIREFYEDKITGAKKPGKKGIALTVAQWNKIVESFDSIKAAVEASAS